VKLLPAAVVVLAAGAWAALVAGAPRLVSTASSDPAAFVAAWIYRAGGLLCHQQPARSFSVDGVPLPVCARCTGLYAGAAAGAALAWVGLLAARRRADAIGLSLGRWRRLALVCGLPMLVAWIGEHILGASVTNVARFVTALPLGAVAAAIVVCWAGGARFRDSLPATAIH
jgi:uncharacterized membrane protein